MITAEEFFRNKIREQNPNREVVTLSQELITAEEAMRWAHEFKQLHLHDVIGRSEQLCPDCGNTGRRLPQTLDSPDGQECECGA